MNTTPPTPPSAGSSIHKRITLVLQAMLLLGIALSLLQREWMRAISVAGIMLVSLAPLVLGRRFRVFIPPEFEVLAIVFLFASLFLGEVRGYYVRFWWWDIVLHTASGVLLGILGFLLVHVLNEKEEIELHMRPVFVALFAFMFAVGLGALWEIFEFTMDRGFGANMQKPMLGDPSGLTDTMWDLIVDCVGALVISCLGWWYMHRRERSFIEAWIRKFIDRNPTLFDG